MISNDGYGYRKSSRSGANGACVETRLRGGVVQVRDSKLSVTAPVLSMAPSDLTALLVAAGR